MPQPRPTNHTLRALRELIAAGADRIWTRARRRAAELLGLGTLALAAAGFAPRGFSLVPPAHAQMAPRPNIIFILADDLGYGDVGFNGQTMIQTPELDRLRAEGMNLTRHYAGSAVCAPSRACLMTGLHTGHVSVPHFTPTERSRWRIEDITVAQLLQGAGYRTHFVGKWGFGAHAEFNAERDPAYPEHDLPNPAEFHATPAKMGFDDSLSYLNHLTAHYHLPQYLWRGDAREPLAGNRHVPYGTYTTNPHMPDIGSRTDYSQDVFMDEVLGTIAAADGSEPFYFQVSSILPHRETIAPGPAGGQFNPYSATGWPSEEQAYAAMISYLDRDVGRILDAVKANAAIAGNTLIIFSADNGAQFTDGRAANFTDTDSFFDSNGPLRGNKFNLFEGGIRMPTLAWWPGTIAPGSTSDHVSTFWDFLPTACELAGATPPSGLDGISYAPTLTGNGAQATHDFLFFRDYNVGGQGPGDPWSGEWAVRRGDWKLIVRDAAQGGGQFLYNLATDPGETTDVAAANPGVVSELYAIVLNMDDAPRAVAPAVARLTGDAILQPGPALPPAAPAVTGDTVAYYRFDGDGKVAGQLSENVIDASGAGRDGLTHGANQYWANGASYREPPLYHADVATARVPLSRQLNTLSLNLNSTLTQYVDVSDHPSLDLETGSFTLEAFVRLLPADPVANPGLRQFVYYKKELGQVDAEIQYTLMAHAGDLAAAAAPVYGKTSDFTGREPALLFGNGSAIWGAVSSFEIVDDRWHYLAVALDAAAGRIRFTLDGAHETIDFVDQGHTSLRNGPLLIGAHHNSAALYNLFFAGKVDECRISNAFLAPEELLRHPIEYGAPVEYVIDFGTVELADPPAPIARTFRVRNDASGYSNLLAGTFDGAGLTDPRLSVAGGTFRGLADGAESAEFSVTLNPTAAGPLEDQTSVIEARRQRHGTPAAGGPVTLRVTGEVIEPPRTPVRHRWNRFD